MAVFRAWRPTLTTYRQPGNSVQMLQEVELPQSQRQSRGLGGADPHFDVCSSISVCPSGADRGGDSADASGGATDVGEGAGEVAPPQVVLGAVDGISAQSHVRGIDAAGEVALVTQHRVVGTGPPQPRNHAVLELVGEQVRGNGAAAGGPGQAGRPKDWWGAIFERCRIPSPTAAAPGPVSRVVRA